MNLLLWLAFKGAHITAFFSLWRRSYYFISILIY
jgi:hypothetical protein